jgi:hypothetical protein
MCTAARLPASGALALALSFGTAASRMLASAALCAALALADGGAASAAASAAIGIGIETELASFVAIGGSGAARSCVAPHATIAAPAIVLSMRTRFIRSRF